MTVNACSYSLERQLEALCSDIKGVERLARRHEEPISLGAAETRIGEVELA
jgi:hypothetical protein